MRQVIWRLHVPVLLVLFDWGSPSKVELNTAKLGRKSGNENHVILYYIKPICGV